jgi:HEAT repeat protein
MSYQELLDQAQHASQIEDWALLNQCLQQLLLGEETPTAQGSCFTDSQTASLLDLVFQVLKFGSFQERWEIVKLFPAFSMNAGDSQVPKVIAPLIDLLQDEDADPDAQWFAVRALGEFNHSQVIIALIEVLKTSDNEELKGMAVTALAQIGKPTIPVLAELLSDDSTRLFAVQTLGHIRHSETVPVLLGMVNDADAQVRAIAVESLGSFHSPQITNALVQALSDLAAPVRRAAVSALGFCTPDDMGDIDVVAHLHPLLRDLNIEVCCQSAIALSRIGTVEAIEALSDVLRSPHTPERLSIEITRALVWTNQLEALNQIRQALSGLALPDGVRLEMVTALGRLDDTVLKGLATQILLDVLNQNSIATTATARQAIALSLGQLSDPCAINPLIHLLADPDIGVQLHVISALKMINPTVAHQALADLSKTALPAELREGVAIALQEWNIHSA